MSWYTQKRGFGGRLAGTAASVLLIVALLSGSLCAAPVCAMPAPQGSSGCAGMDMPKAPVSIAGVSVPACCQISQAPPARTQQNTTLQRAESTPLAANTIPAVVVSFAPKPVVFLSLVLAPPIDQQSRLSVFLI